MFDLQRCIGFLLVLFLNLQSLEQNLSLDINPICTVVLYYPRDSIVDSYLCDECKKSNEPSVCHKLLSILWLFWQVCLRTKECQVYQFVLNTSFKRIWEHTVDNSPTASNSSFLKLWSSKQGVETFCNCSVFFVCQFTISLDALLSMSFHVGRPCDRLCVRFLPPC